MASIPSIVTQNIDLFYSLTRTRMQLTTHTEFDVCTSFSYSFIGATGKNIIKC